MKKNKNIFTAAICYVFLILVSGVNVSIAEDGYSFKGGSELTAFSMAESNEFHAYKKEVLSEYQVYRNILAEEFSRYKKEIAKFWVDVDMSTAKTWIEYSKDYKTRKIVDYENGVITIETVVDKRADEKTVDKKIIGSLTDLATETNKTAFERDILAQNIEERLVASIEDVKVSDSIDEVAVASDLITGEESPDKDKIALSVKEIKENGTINVKPARSGNDKIISFQVKIPDSRLQKKALKYAENVEKYSKEQNLDAPLVFAIMQTESSFNPMARSHIPAYGLMQIVPRSAGKDAANALFGEYRLLAPSFLYDCENNIKVGTAYISVVMYKYLRKIKNMESRTYCAIAAYNTGTTNVARAFIPKPRMSEAARVINKMSPDEVYNTLIENLPHDETRNYLKKVKTRMKHYVVR